MICGKELLNLRAPSSGNDTLAGIFDSCWPEAVLYPSRPVNSWVVLILEEIQEGGESRNTTADPIVSTKQPPKVPILKYDSPRVLDDNIVSESICLQLCLGKNQQR